MECGKAEDNLAKLSISNPNNAVAMFFRESVMLDILYLTSIEQIFLGKEDPEIIHQIKNIT